MDEQLFSKVREFIPSPEAAKMYAVTNDYIARLCRLGKLNGVLEGRVWMVQRKSLESFFGVRNGNVVPEIRPKEYLPSKEAAGLYRVTNDYIARLCRRGKVQGTME